MAVLAAGFLAATVVTAIPSAALSTPRDEPGRPVAAPAAEEASSPSEPLVVLWGDSLAWESADTFAGAVRRATDAEVRARTFGGTAPCDWLDDVDAMVARADVTVAVLEFSGNAFTPCMRDRETGAPLAGDRLVETYARDLERILAILEEDEGTTRVHLVGAPPSRHEDPAGPVEVLRSLYRRLAGARDDTVFVPAGEAVLADGVFTETLPCLAVEDAPQGCVNGRIRVRSADGVHFCPTATHATAGVVERCPVWSSGAHRFGTAMAAAVERDLHSSSMGSTPSAGRRT